MGETSSKAKGEKGQKKTVQRSRAPKAEKQATVAKGSAKPKSKTAGKRVGAGRKSPAVRAVPISTEKREAMIAEAAYYRAENRGFIGGDPAADWLSAEVEIDAWLARQQQA